MVRGAPQKFTCSYSEARLIRMTESLRQTGISEPIKTELCSWHGFGRELAKLLYSKFLYELIKAAAYWISSPLEENSVETREVLPKITLWNCSFLNCTNLQHVQSVSQLLPNSYWQNLLTCKTFTLFVFHLHFSSSSANAKEMTRSEAAKLRCHCISIHGHDAWALSLLCSPKDSEYLA